LGSPDAAFSGAALVMKQDKPFSPVTIGFFGAVGIMLQPDGIAKLVEKFFGLWRGWIGHG
jgi:hypothetical protein